MLLSLPNSSHLAVRSPHHAPRRHSPTTPPRQKLDLFIVLNRLLSFSTQRELYFQNCLKVILLGSGMELGSATNLEYGFCDILIKINMNNKISTLIKIQSSIIPSLISAYSYSSSCSCSLLESSYRSAYRASSISHGTSIQLCLASIQMLYSSQASLLYSSLGFF